MLLRVVSSEWELFHNTVDKVSVPTEQGILWILPWHMNIVCPLIAGAVIYIPTENPKSSLDSFADHHDTLFIKWWLMMIDDNVVTIAAE